MTPYRSPPPPPHTHTHTQPPLYFPAALPVCCRAVLTHTHNTIRSKLCQHMKLMVPLWTPMDPIWPQYGPPMDPLWPPYGPPMDPLWAIYALAYKSPEEAFITLLSRATAKVGLHCAQLYCPEQQPKSVFIVLNCTVPSNSQSRSSFCSTGCTRCTARRSRTIRKASHLHLHDSHLFNDEGDTN